MPVPQLSPRDLAERLAAPEPLALIDVRDGWELELAHIDGARHVPLDMIVDEAAALPRDRDVVFVCHHGSGRPRAAERHARPGGRASKLAGGIGDWIGAARDELQSMRRDGPVALSGLSLGGAIATILAAESTGVPALVLLAPYVALPDSIRRFLRVRIVATLATVYLKSRDERS